MRDELHRRVYGRTPEARQESRAKILAADCREKRRWKLSAWLESDPDVLRYRAEKAKRGERPR